MAPLAVKQRFKQAVARILEVDTWPEFFKHVGIACPTPDTLTTVLYGCKQRSLSKGYHSPTYVCGVVGCVVCMGFGS